MKTLILYSSHDGQTKKIAEFLATLVKGFVQVQPLQLGIDISDFDRVIIGASIRYGHFNKMLYQFIEKNVELLQERQNAFFGVNLTARKAGKDTPETNSYIQKFLARISWRPEYVAVFAGALLYPRYKWFDRIMIQLIMRLTGGETDPTKEIEYTDWSKVESFAEKLNLVEISPLK